MNDHTIDQLRWSHLFEIDFVVDYDAVVHVEDTPDGIRSLFPVRGGTFRGERLSGTVLDHGSDFVRWRHDGAMLIDVRTMLRTDDDQLIAMHYTGISYGEPEAMERFKRREAISFTDVYSRTTPRFETGSEKYAWLNRRIFVANGMRTTGAGPKYHVFSID